MNASMVKGNLKKSNYNIINSSKKVVFNTFSGALIEFGDIEWSYFLEIIENPNISSDSSTDVIKNRMLEQGCLIPEDYNEREILQHRYFSEKYDKTHLGLTIIPAFECNFACKYCYEKNKKGRMGKKELDNLIYFIKDKINKDSIRKFTVQWYGGEPLLEFDKIIELSKIFRDISDEKEIYYNSMMVTNGYELDRKRADAMVEMGLSFIQVTLDGPEFIHDKRRFLKNGNGTFRQITSNLKYASKLLNIVIRINIDKENQMSMDELLTYIKESGLGENVAVYFERVWDDSETYQCKVCEPNEFSDLADQFYLKAVDQGLKLDIPLVLRDSYCVADKINGFVINYDGTIVKCWEDLENAKELDLMYLGSTKSGITEIQKISKWMNLNPFTDEECFNCLVLPLCVGGCPKRRLEGEKRCEYIKNKLNDYINLLKYKESNSKK